MGFRFDHILVGDMFNTSVGRYVKISETTAICVMSSIDPVGKISVFEPEFPIILLWSALLRC